MDDFLKGYLDKLLLKEKGGSFFFFSPDGSDSKASAYNAGDLGSIPGLGIPPGEGNGNPLQYSCLENHMDTVHRVAESDTIERLHFIFLGWLSCPV